MECLHHLYPYQGITWVYITMVWALHLDVHTKTERVHSTIISEFSIDTKVGSHTENPASKQFNEDNWP